MGELILNKKYKLQSSENFDEFMKAIGKYPKIIFSRTLIG